MLIRTFVLLILTLVLSGCATKSYNTCLKGEDLPEMPLAGEMVALEIEQVCTDSHKCFHLNNWLNELYLFRKQYLIYKKK